MSDLSHQNTKHHVTREHSRQATTPYLSMAGLILSGAIILLLWYYDTAVFELEIIPKTGPDFSPYSIGRTIIITGTSLLMILSIYSLGSDEHGSSRQPSIILLSIALTYVFLCGIVMLYLVNPAEFHRQSLEDSAIEYTSALLLLTAAFLYLQVFVTSLRHQDRTSARIRGIVLAPLCALVLFVIGMEELSWMQRILDINTPDAFSGNGQGEMNFHNYYTRSSHALYVMGAWGCLIFLPFFLSFGPRVRILAHLEGFLPDRRIAALSVPLAGLFYPSWGFMVYQMIFFTSVLIMLIFANHARRAGRVGETVLFGTGAVVLAVAQGVFLLTENRFGRIWDVSEYQEFFIALGLAALAWSVRRQWQTVLDAPSASVTGRHLTGSRP